MKKRITLFMVFFLTSYVLAYAQDLTVKGVVKDTQGSPMPGVSVKLKNSKTGSSTDGNGRYTIAVSGKAVLFQRLAIPRLKFR